VGHVWACSESVAARALPQKQVTVGAPRGRVGSPRRLWSAARNLRVGEGVAAGGWECLKPRGGTRAGHAAETSLCNLSVHGAAVQASE
jgi:hypothetical protein